MDIEAWLRGLGLGHYAGAFVENDIDEQTLPHLTTEDLEDIGIVSVGHRRKILTAVQELNRFAVAPNPAQQPDQLKLSRHTPRHLADRILDDLELLEGQQKPVTVLFADICGSTQITEGLGPEDAAELLRPALRCMIDAVHDYEGTVNKVQGDGIMALFGAPIAHEDHAVRGCYAALAMQERIRGIAGQSRQTHGVEIVARVGLHSGDVLVRGIGNDLTMDYDAIGPTVHLASRMEQMAVPGSIRITPEVLRLAEGFIAVEALGPAPVKGISKPVEVFALAGAGPAQTRLDAAAIRGLSPFVGRKEQLESLAQALSEADAGHGQMVAVSGEPGIGKSRLFREFLGTYHTKSWLILSAAGVAFSKTTPWSLAIGLLRSYFGIRNDDGKREITERVLGKCMVLDPALKDRLAAFLSLFGVEGGDADWMKLSAPQRRRAVLDGLKALIARASLEQHLILVLEDLHWADSESLAFLDEFLSGIATQRILVLANFRPEFSHAWTNRNSFRQLPLAPLSEKAAEQFMEKVVGVDPSLSELRTLLLQRSNGNPLFLEESLRTLAEAGCLAGKSGAYRLVRAVQPFELPASIEALIAARIDGLDAQTRSLLQAAAVVGADTTTPLLAAVTDQDADTVIAGLSRLARMQLLIEARLFPDIAYRFKHVLVQEVAYGGLLKKKKIKLHRAVGTAIETLHSNRPDEVAEALAHHFLKGCDNEKAAHYLLSAARKAKSRYAYPTALSYADEAAGSAHAVTTARAIEIRALIISGEVKSLMGDVDGANGAFEAASTLVDDPDVRREIGNKRHRHGSAVRAGGQISFYEQGTQGETVIVVKPLAYGIAWLQPVVELLCGKYRIVTIEERGAPASDPVPEHYTFDDHVADIKAVIRKLNRGPVAGVGVSRGSTALMMLAARYPDMFSRLVLVGAGVDWISPNAGPSEYDAWGAAMLESIEKRGYEAAVRDFAAEILSEPGVEEIREAFVQQALRNVKAMRAFARNAPRGDPEKICRAVRTPTLLIHGSDDLDVPIQSARSLLELLPNAELHICNGRGHLPIFTAPYEFCEIFEHFVPEGHVPGGGA